MKINVWHVLYLNGKKIEEEAQQLFKEGDKFGEKNIQMEKE